MRAILVRRRHAFLPELAALEGRICLSGGAPRSSRGAALVSEAAAIAPAPGTYPTPEAWMETHLAMKARGDAQVVFLGDSTVAFWLDPGWVGRNEAAWRQMLGPLMGADFGIPGDRAENVLARVLDGDLAGRPRLAVLLVGINDPIAGRTPVETAATNLAIARVIRVESPGTRVLLLGVLPADDSPKSGLRGAIRLTNALMQAGSRMPGVSDLDLSRGLTRRDGTLGPGLSSTDRLHPIAAGYDRIADTLSGPVRRLAGG